MENLAPAGNRAALERAVAAGADAVYLGYSLFGARASAGNFNREELADAVRYAHLHRVKVHVTVNTLVKDAELPDLLEVLCLLRELSVDAILVQDLGVLLLARRFCPELTVHASTQMSLHNRTGARWCRTQGMKRVVLSRECSLDEIRLAAQEPIEIETFVHGAQCVAVSGMCLFSSAVGGRSGNRGRCAQPCRMEYTFDGKRGAWLSPRDVCLRNDLPALKAAGVRSLKIEGRLKRPEYVAVVASSYRKAIDGTEEGTFTPADSTEMRNLKQIFQRGGFMRGYAMGCEDAAVICPGRVNHAGVEIGTVTGVRDQLARIALRECLHDGDTLQLQGRQESGELIYAGKDTPAGETALLRLRSDLRVTPGDRVVRLTDAQQMREANELPEPQIPVDMHLSALPGEPLTLTLSDGNVTVTVRGDAVSAARTRATAPDEMCRNLRKTGGTAFTVTGVQADTDNAFVPLAALNELRRKGLNELAEARIAAFESTAAVASVPVADASADQLTKLCDLPAAAEPLLSARSVRCVEDIQPEAGLRWILYPEDYREPALREMLNRMPAGTWLQLPPVCEEATLRMLHGLVTEYRDCLGGVVLGNVGQLGLAWPVPYGAGSDIPVMNRAAARLLLEEGCSFVTASGELSGRELETLCAGHPPILVPAYGRTQLMLLHHCPARTALGLKKGHAACTMCDERVPEALRGKTLKDRFGHEFPLLRLRLPEGCMIRLMNSAVTDLRTQTADMPTLEEYTLPGTETTKGHWNRPVE